jgi:hypothetical protein
VRITGVARSIRSSRLNQRADQFAALVGFGMPLDSQDEPLRRRFDRFWEVVEH